MACPRGAAHPDAHTQRRLFASSGGYCQNPACERELFCEVRGKRFHIAEMAHVFAASADGPRSNDALSEAERGSYANLILLCPICHTTVDKAPDAFPDSLILGWKRNHDERLRKMFGVVRYETRHEARASIEPLLDENRQIFDDYGPHIDAANDPESGAAERWTRKVLQKIIPNNSRVLNILETNKELLLPSERIASEQFRQHIDDLIARHIEGFAEGAARFPIAISTMLKDADHDR